jgi:hypothetical protein
MIGSQYYVAARGAWHRTMYWIIGNLLHHGFEMMLKSLLLQAGTSPENLKDNFGHSLPKLWTTFKVGRRETWSEFDGFIEELQRFEEIRYGGFPKGLSKAIHIHGVSGMVAIPSLGEQDRYDVDMETADRLFAGLAMECGLGPPAHIREQYIGADALEDYERSNLHVLRANGPA